jgi:hypothetical protein
MDLDQRLHDVYGERLDGLPLPAGDLAAARRAGRALRTRRRLAVGLAAAASVAVAVGGTLVGTGHVAIGPSGGQGSWRRLPTPPLSPRADALAVWTGKEVVVVGGDTHPCPPNADCLASRGRHDGAAYDPGTRTWRRIAPAPVQVGPGDRLVSAAGRVILRHQRPHGSRLLVYDPAADRWSEVPALLDDLPSAIGDDVYGLRHGRVVVYDATRGVWDHSIPRDAITPRLVERRVTATAYGPVVSGYDSSRPHDGTSASVVVADVFDGTRWRRLPPTGQLSNDWSWTGSRMVTADPSVVDGGEVDPYPRPYPAGGLLDPSTGHWSPLPQGFSDSSGSGWGVYAVGGPWVASFGQVYDTATGRVQTLPPPGGARDQGVAAAWARGRLLVFGGASFGVRADLTNGAWLYTP